MHQSVMNFLADAVDRYDLAGKKVLEVGARIVNGSPRELFDSNYWGIDILSGPGVDEVVNAHILASQNGRCALPEVIVCAEMLEHDDAPWLSLTQMRLSIKPGGILLVTARGYNKQGFYKVHDRCYDSDGEFHVGDYWRFSVGGMRRMLEQAGWEVLTCEPDSDPERPGVFAVARA